MLILLNQLISYSSGFIGNERCFDINAGRLGLVSVIQILAANYNAQEVVMRKNARNGIILVITLFPNAVTLPLGRVFIVATKRQISPESSHGNWFHIVPLVLFA